MNMGSVPNSILMGCSNCHQGLRVKLKRLCPSI